MILDAHVSSFRSTGDSENMYAKKNEKMCTIFLDLMWFPTKAAPNNVSLFFSETLNFLTIYQRNEGDSNKNNSVYVHRNFYLIFNNYFLYSRFSLFYYYYFNRLLVIINSQPLFFFGFGYPLHRTEKRFALTFSSFQCLDGIFLRVYHIVFVFSLLTSVISLLFFLDR